MDLAARSIVRLRFRYLTQTLICGDITDRDTRDAIIAAVGPGTGFVYSDPPWNQGNEKYWRRYAGVSNSSGYAHFLDCWADIASRCVAGGFSDLLVEHSLVEESLAEMRAAVVRADIEPLRAMGMWNVLYTLAAGAGKARWGSLLHYGRDPLVTDPTGLSGEQKAARACAGLVHRMPPGSVIVDPCIGKGKVSRLAHTFQWNCVGCELSQKRLDITIGWLEKRGYERLD